MKSFLEEVSRRLDIEREPNRYPTKHREPLDYYTKLGRYAERSDMQSRQITLQDAFRSLERKH